MAYTRIFAVSADGDVNADVYVAADIFNFNCAISIREKLHVPLGWCSSGFKENEYTFIPIAGQFSWHSCGITVLK